MNYLLCPQTDVDAAREAYNAFLGHYPYCYGYWRKYADYEKTKGDKSKCQEVSDTRRWWRGDDHHKNEVCITQSIYLHRLVIFDQFV